MRTLFLTLLAGAFIPAAFADTAFTVNCAPTAGTNAVDIGFAVHFTAGTGTGSFACSDASLGLATLSAVTIEIFTDYEFGDGNANDPNDNSARFTFTNSATTWDNATAGVSATTMQLPGGVTVFVIGNLSSGSDTFTNTTSGGLAGTSYLEPVVDDITGSLLDNFTINASAFIDAGGFSNGDSTAHIKAIYTGTQNPVPEPMTMLLTGAGLLGVGFLARKKRAQ